jgi:hypothetical protein
MRFLIRSTYASMSFLALSATSSTQVGFILREQKINETAGGFPAALDRDDRFGHGLARLDDLDGDGVPELAVGASRDDDGGRTRGAVWILFLDARGSVKRATKISQTSGGFGGILLDAEQFGSRLAALGDLDRDGLPELAVTSLRRVRVLFLAQDGTVRRHAEILHSDAVFAGATDPSDFLGGGLGAVGDLDRDGTADLAWGAPNDDTVAEDAGAVWILHLEPDGSARSARRIAPGEGGFTGRLRGNDYFGVEIRSLGDVNGDGLVDLGVLDREPSLGRIWVLFLDADARVSGHGVINGHDFRMLWRQREVLGFALESLGDLDGDGITEVAAHSFGFRDHGGVGLGFLARDGSLRKRVAIGNGREGLALDPNRGEFGWSIARLGDLDGDGTLEVAVGDPYADDSGLDAGSVSILSLDLDAARNGSGVNSVTLRQSTEPVLGQPWSVKLDCSGRRGGLAYVYGFDRPHAGLLLPAGELLVDVFGGEQLFRLVAHHAGAPVVLSAGVPNDIALWNQVLYVQGVCSGPGGPRLSNALDVRIGR